MDVTYLSIDTAQLAADISEFENAVANVDKQANEFKNEMDKLNSMWKGKAKEAFKNQADIDYELILDLINDMRKLVSCMDNAKEEYIECEKAVKASVDNIKI